MTSFAVRPEDVTAAGDLLRGIVSGRPLLHSRVLSERLGGPVYLKCENLQRTGSFKARGGYVRMARLTEADRARGVVVASAGNHAQGVAFAAASLGIKATVFMPEGAPLPKIEATSGDGADVILHGASVEDAMAAAIAHGRGAGQRIHPPVRPPGRDRRPGHRRAGDPRPVPGRAHHRDPGRRRRARLGHRASRPRHTIQASASSACRRRRRRRCPPSIAAGHPVRIEAAPTMADGITVSHVGELTFPILSELADRILTVSEEGLSRALLLCLERAKQLVEPAGAAGVAALLEHPHAFEPPVVACSPAGTSTRCCWPRCSGTG